MVPTVIRHKLTANGFIVVITVMADVRLQEYNTFDNATQLVGEWVYSSEQMAIDSFNEMQAE